MAGKGQGQNSLPGLSGLAATALTTIGAGDPMVLPHIAGHEDGIHAPLPVPSVPADRHPLSWADQSFLLCVSLLLPPWLFFNTQGF